MTELGSAALERSASGTATRRPAMAAFLLRRLGLMILTLFLLSLIVFFAGQILPGDPGRATLGNLASPERGAGPRPAARGEPAAAHPVPDLDRRAAARQPGHVLRLPVGGRALHQGRADQLGQAGRARLRDRGAAGHPGRGDLRAVRGPRHGPGHLGDRALAVHRAGVRVRDRAAGGVRCRAEVAAGDRVGRGRRVAAEPAQAPDLAGDTARFCAVRLHFSYGQGGDRRGAELRLHADRGAEGPAAVHGDPPGTSCATRCCRPSP